MAKQPSYRPQEHSSFFEDGRASRPPVPGTVARDALRDDALTSPARDDSLRDAASAASFTGFSVGNPLVMATSGGAIPGGFAVLDYADTFPVPITADVLERGRQRYTIFCAVCHDPTGNGKGKIVERGYTKPPSYITDLSRGLERRGYKVLLRDAPVGYYFEVVSKGYGAMADYSFQVPPADRWAIIAYIRALQLSQYAPLDKLPPDEKQSAIKALGGKP
jgi:mono/diheme cytochrome c family protein